MRFSSCLKTQHLYDSHVNERFKAGRWAWDNRSGTASLSSFSGLPINRSGVVQAVITSAWRRRLFVLTIEQLAFALTVVFAGAIVMLLLGTQLFAWYWLLLLAAAGLAIGFARIRSRLIQRYEVAQVLDRRLALNDSLSTAWFLLSGKELSDNPAARYQIHQAEELAAAIHAS